MIVKKSMKVRKDKKLEKFKKILRIVLKSNEFYKKKFKKAGITSADQIKTWNDFYSLPLVSRQELTKDQIRHPPFGTNLTRPLSEYIFCARTSGTTKRPLFLPHTVGDFEGDVKILKESHEFMGVTKKDVFCHPCSPHFILFMFAATKQMGVRMIPVTHGSHSLVDLIGLLKLMKVTVFESFPTLIYQLIEKAEELKIDLKKIGVRKIITEGEPGGGNPATKAFFEKKWGAKVVDHLSSAESPVTAIACPLGQDYHLCEDYLIHEVIDVKTNKPVEKGELVITCLWKKDFPLIRYRTGDIVRIDYSPCPCGQKSPRLVDEVFRGAGEVRLRAVSVYPESIESAIRAYPKVIEYQIICWKKKETDMVVDMVDVFVEIPLNAGFSYIKRLREDLKNTLGFRPRLFLVFPKTLPRFGYKKGKRFLDYRKKGKLSIGLKKKVVSRLLWWILIFNDRREKIAKLIRLLKQDL